MKYFWTKFALVVVLTLAAFIVALPNNDGKILGKILAPSWFPDFNMSLGLDLQGGTQLTYGIDLSKAPVERHNDVVNGVMEVIRRRIDGLGVSEPVIQPAQVGEQRHLIVELPGIKDINQAKEVVGKVVNLQFKEQQTDITPEEKKRSDDENIKRKATADKMLAESLKIGELQKAAALDAKAQFTGSTDFEKIDAVDAAIKETVITLKPNQIEKTLKEDEKGYTVVKLLDKKSEQEKSVAVSHILVAYQGAERAKAEITRTKEEAEKRAKEFLEKVKAGADFALTAKENSDEPTENGELPEPVVTGGTTYVKEFTDGALKLEKNGEILAEVVPSPFGYHVLKARSVAFRPVESVKYEKIFIPKDIPIMDGWKNTELSGEHFERASVSFDQQTMQPIVNIKFNDKGKDIFKNVTERNINKPLAIFLDDKPIIGESVYAPTVNQVIKDGEAMINGSMNRNQAAELARNLNAGAIPAPISLIGQRTVEATLGQNALSDSIKAGAVGLVIILVYMMLFYRMSGVIATIALCIYTLLLLAVFKLFVTLSLAGIAGIIFSIGVAIDANILIFERMKEEIKQGKSLKVAINEGFHRAWTSIFDSNMSSLITCALLFYFGSGMVRGFALTLSIGILISMFTAMTVTRILLTFFTKFTGASSSVLVGVKEQQ